MSAASLLRLFLLAALWGGSFLFMRIAAPVLGAPVTAFLRVLLGVAGLYAWVRILGLPRQFDGKWRTSLLLGVVVGALAFQERVTLAGIIGVALGLLGVAVLVNTELQQPTDGAIWGIAACLAATTCYAFAGFLTVRWISRRGGLDSRLVALGSQVGACLLLLPFALAQLIMQPLHIEMVSARVWLSVLGLGLLCTSLGYVLYFRLIADEGALKALTVTFLIPLFGALWGWLVLNETLGLPHLAGAALIAQALLLVMQGNPSASAPTPAALKPASTS